MGMHGCSWHVLEAQAKCVYDPVHNALPRLYPMWPDVHESIMTLRVIMAIGLALLSSFHLCLYYKCL